MHFILWCPEVTGSELCLKRLWDKGQLFQGCGEGTEALEPRPVSPGVSIPFWPHPLPSAHQRGVGWADHRTGCVAERSRVFPAFCSARKAARSGDRQDNRIRPRGSGGQSGQQSGLLEPAAHCRHDPVPPWVTSKALGWLLGFSCQRRKQGKLESSNYSRNPTALWLVSNTKTGGRGISLW